MSITKNRKLALEKVEADKIYTIDEAAALVKEMVASDVSLFKKELYIKQSRL